MRGQKVGLVGETGCGKTVSMKAILRMLPIPPARIVKGDVVLDGKDIFQLNLKELRTLRRTDISLIPQSPQDALNPVFKIRTQMMDLVRYSFQSQGNLSKRRIEGLITTSLEELDLKDPVRVLDSYPFQLSGGMQQRTLIAMALLSASKLLIADEPTTALDVTIQYEILELIRHMVEDKGLSLLMITHNLGIIRELTDVTYVMYGGQVVERARTPDVFAEPMHPYTKGLMMAVPSLSGKGLSAGIKGRIPDYGNPPAGCRFRPRCVYSKPECEQKPPFKDIQRDHIVRCIVHEDSE